MRIYFDIFFELLLSSSHHITYQNAFTHCNSFYIFMDIKFKYSSASASSFNKHKERMNFYQQDNFMCVACQIESEIFFFIHRDSWVNSSG